MPRSARGGIRTATPSKTYGQRTDLNTSPNLPVTTVPDQPYGEAGQQAQAEQAVPLPNAQAPLAKIVQQAAQLPQGPVAGTTPPPSPMVGAGDLGALTRPTERPFEPVTHGSPTGPGGGPEVLGPVPATKVSQTLAQVAQATGNPSLQFLAQHAMAQGQ